MMQKKRETVTIQGISYHGIVAACFINNTRGTWFKSQQMHAILITCITKLVDDVICAISFSNSMLIWFAHCVNIVIMQINMTHHTSAPDTNIKKEFRRGCMLKLVMMPTFSTSEYCEMV